jgi:hypothetical protein
MPNFLKSNLTCTHTHTHTYIYISKGKLYPRTGHKGSEGEYSYSSTL